MQESAKFTAIATLVLLLALSLGAFAQAPNTIMYQGRLTDANGDPLVGPVTNVKFTIYRDPAPDVSNPIYYTVTKSITCDDNGVFTTELGPITDPNAFSGAERYLGIKIGTDDEMTPYQELSSTLYSMSTAKAPGVEWVEPGHGAVISTVSTTSGLTSIDVTAPSAGYVIVTASGSIYWNIASTAYGMIRLKVSDTNNDITETPGIQFIRTEFPGTGTNPNFPFSVSKVFPVASAGTYKFYFNAWHQVVNGSASMNDYSLIGIFVPNRY